MRKIYENRPRVRRKLQKLNEDHQDNNEDEEGSKLIQSFTTANNYLKPVNRCKPSRKQYLVYLKPFIQKTGRNCPFLVSLISCLIIALLYQCKVTAQTDFKWKLDKQPQESNTPSFGQVSKSDNTIKTIRSHHDYHRQQPQQQQQQQQQHYVQAPYISSIHKHNTDDRYNGGHKRLRRDVVDTSETNDDTTVPWQDTSAQSSSDSSVTSSGSEDYSDSSASSHHPNDGLNRNQARTVPRSTIAISVPPLNSGQVYLDKAKENSLSKRTESHIDDTTSNSQYVSLSSAVSANNANLMRIPSRSGSNNFDLSTTSASNDENPLTVAMNVNMGNERFLIKPAITTTNDRSWPQNHINTNPVSTGHAHETLNQVFRSVSGLESNNLNHDQNHHMLLMMSPDLHARMDSVGDLQTSCYTRTSMILVIMITIVATLSITLLIFYAIKHLGRRQFDLVESSKQFDSHYRPRPAKNTGAPSGMRIYGTQNHKPSWLLSAPNGDGLALNHYDDDDNFGALNYNCALKVTGCRELGQANNVANDDLERCAFANPYFRPDEASVSNISKRHDFDISQINQSSSTTSETAFTAVDYDEHLHDHESQSSGAKIETGSGLLAVTGRNDLVKQNQLQQQYNREYQHCNMQQQQYHQHQHQHHHQHHQHEQIQQQDQQNQQQHQNSTGSSSEAPSTGTASGCSPLQDSIEHHISNLHSRQVTSSVKELTISAGRSPDLRAISLPENNPSTSNGIEQLSRVPVVDLRNGPNHQNMFNAVQGDLVAVDISGQDFIGLGFEVCGNQRDGIHIRSVLANGPARESGLINVGDRIKCLNISFDGITLQDARDILNCGSPYKLRVLLEKGSPDRLNFDSSLGRKKRSSNNNSWANGNNIAAKQLKCRTINFLSDTQQQIKQINQKRCNIEASVCGQSQTCYITHNHISKGLDKGTMNSPADRLATNSKSPEMSNRERKNSK